MSAFRCGYCGKYSSQQTNRLFLLKKTGYDDMSSGNCTSNIVIINTDTVNYMGFMFGNVMITSGLMDVCVARMTSKLYLLYSSTSRLSEYIDSSSFTAFPSLSQQNICKGCPITGSDWGNLCHACCSSSEQLSVNTHTALWSSEPKLWCHV
jgi:hypothetical protein